MFHEIYTITPEEFEALGKSSEVLCNLAEECAKDYYEEGFQIVYAVHQSKDLNCHVHFVGNAVNFENGKKYHCSKNDLKERNALFDQRLLEKCQEDT